MQYPNLIGFDKLLDAMASAPKIAPGFPPYNVVKKDANNYQIQVALAGYNTTDIDVEVQENQLKISSKGITAEHDTEFVYRGWSFKGFNRAFTLADHVEVKRASMKDGVLTVDLERVLPETKKPKKVKIETPTEESHPQLLNESSDF